MSGTAAMEWKAQTPVGCVFNLRNQMASAQYDPGGTPANDGSEHARV